jgi:hypothetical protein
VSGDSSPTVALPVRLREAADRVSNHCFHKPGDSALMSIPARPGYDVDLLLVEAAELLEKFAAEVERLAKWNTANPMNTVCGESAVRRIAAEMRS